MSPFDSVVIVTDNAFDSPGGCPASPPHRFSLRGDASSAAMVNEAAWSQRDLHPRGEWDPTAAMGREHVGKLPARRWSDPVPKGRLAIKVPRA